MEQLKLAEAEGMAFEADIDAVMTALGRDARAAARALAASGDADRSAALRHAAASVRARTSEILAANRRDLAEAAVRRAAPAFVDRLALDSARIEGIATGLEAIAALPDPVDRVLARFERPNGLVIERVAVPLGVIGIVFESRPAVTADAGALCLKAGNAAILRGGSESFHSASLIHACLVDGLRAAGLPEAAITLVPVRDRAAVGAMLRNAKLRRTSVCGAAETLLVDRGSPLHRDLVLDMLDAGCEIRGDVASGAVDPRVVPATDADWRTEYLDAILAVKVVDGLEAAIAHVERYGSRHTDCIVAEDAAAAARFLREVDSAIVLHNASTQFADGGEFGFGGEIGIATGRLHARGPVGVDQLTTFKYKVHGTGQVRP